MTNAPANGHAGMAPSNDTLAKTRIRFSGLINAAMRLLSLMAKLALTFYMGRYLTLAEMGTYGLVAATVVIANPLLGFRLEYFVSRELLAEKPFDLAIKLKDQLVFYALTYVVATAVVVALGALGITLAESEIVLVAIPLAILENAATVTSANLVTLGRPLLANAMFFLRSAVWVAPVVLLGTAEPRFRNVETLFVGWFAGVTLSLIATVYHWRRLPWLDAVRQAVNWAWLVKALRVCFFVWLGAVGTTLATNADRFVLDEFVGREAVGVASFYGSFVTAMSSLLYSGVFSFGVPRLMSHFRLADRIAFRREVYRLTKQALVGATAIVVVVAVAVPQLGSWMGQPALLFNAPTLWWLLVGVWLRSVTESIYYAMYARHDDAPIWLGNVLFLALTLGANWLLVPRVGLVGVGYSATLGAIFMLCWRVWYIFKRLNPDLREELGPQSGVL